MNQTNYAGPKATFFPSNATATTNGSSGNYSQNHDRATESGLRQHQLGIAVKGKNTQPLKLGQN